ncbi:uncharacterized protein YukE [Amycolatopsis bartoniae]|uniref:WXG100 family type VII secretion target n=1 Tax=Amycolatopsis bartoniae TaxID=941986 RepID=A0A8H9ISS5_9PSEU|nr:WXG100 family type VII secretion target [Amycolatopsis bartoniae]MBB2937965.1 uncharacterized protein YukE [Amycolatopsis bartoniae]GHF42013.1 hypothetical protein GCM10017566_14440 [Amycolatopsis bartoniae]
MAERTWDEVKALLDDPAVPPGDKTGLISSWIMAHPGEPDEAGRYASAYNANPFVAKSVDDAYDAAKRSGDQASYNDDADKKAVDDGKTQLEDKQEPAAGGGGTRNSDEIFDAAEPALKVFQTFGSLLAKLPDDCRGNTRPLDYATDIKKRYDEQRGIDFQGFADDAGHFKAGSQSVDQTVQDTGSALSTLFQSWTGGGADAASDHYNEQIQPKAVKLSQTLEGVSEAVGAAVTTVFQLCKGKADAVIEMYTDQVGKADYALAQKVVAVASGEHGSKDDLAQIAGWMDANFGTDLVKTLDDDGCCDDDDIQRHGQDLAKQWIQRQFNPEMWDVLYKGFDKLCKDTLDLVDQAYDALDKVMGKVENEFGDGESAGSFGGSGPGSGSGTGSSGYSGSGSGSGAGPGSSYPGDGYGGGTGSGSGSGAGGSVPDLSGSDADTPSSADSLGGSGSGSSVPDLPGLDGSEDEQLDHLKVEQGGKTFEMTEPDADGKMDIKVDDGSGTPKDFKLDWSRAAGSAADGAYVPGPDGKIHIQDGGTEITAERPDGPDGPTVVTVDDGSGTPTKYTLGEGDGAGKSTSDVPGSVDAFASGSPSSAEPANLDLPEAAEAPDLPVSGDVEDLPAAAEVPDLPVPGDVEDLPEAAEVPDLPVSTDAADLPAAAEVPDLPVSGDVEDLPAAAEVPDLPVSADAADLPVSGGGGGADVPDLGGGGGGTTPDLVGVGESARLATGVQVGAAVPTADAPPGAQSAVPVTPPVQQPAGLAGLGGLGAMGGGHGGGGEDQQRSSRAYRIDGGIFDAGEKPGPRIIGSLDDDEKPAKRR